MQHAASHTTAVQPSSHNQRHVLIGKQWYQLPELIPTNSNSGEFVINLLKNVVLKELLKSVGIWQKRVHWYFFELHFV